MRDAIFQHMAPLPPVELPDVDQVRSELAAAIETRRIAEADVEKARHAVERTRELLNTADGELMAFRQISEHVSTQHARSIADWTANGSGDAPSLDPPPSIAERAERLAAAEHRREVIASALSDLERDQQRAEEALALEVTTVKRAAAAVLAAHTDHRAAELQRLEQAAALLRSDLLSVSTFQPEGMASVPLCRPTRKLLEEKPRNLYTSGDDPGRRAAVRSRFEALLHDPDAEIEAR